MKLARALMMFGSPSHRLETQIQATARVLELNASVVYLPGIMLISFGDDATHTSETKFLKQATGLDLGKLLATHKVYWNVRFSPRYPLMIRLYTTVSPLIRPAKISTFSWLLLYTIHGGKPWSLVVWHLRSSALLDSQGMFRPWEKTNCAYV